MTIIEKLLKAANKLQDKLYGASLVYDNPYDNCLLCQHADFHENEVAKLLRRLGIESLAKTFDAFPVILCKLENGKYVANPKVRPGWCRKVGK